jgi:hypothetical protein
VPALDEVITSNEPINPDPPVEKVNFFYMALMCCRVSMVGIAPNIGTTYQYRFSQISGKFIISWIGTGIA